MRDVQNLLRRGIYQALSGYISVPVYDEVPHDDTENRYVILSTQTNEQDPTLTHFQHDATILIDIVDRQQQSVTKDYVDDVAGEILALIFPAVGTNGIAAQAGVTFHSARVESDNSLNFSLSNAEIIIRRLIRISVKISEQ